MPFDGLQLGHYKLQHMIGSGGMGEVYLAEDTRVARRVAVKIVRTETAPYQDSGAALEIERLFQREMKAITQLDHPRILPLYDFGEEQRNNMTLIYMVMPYRPEGSLNDWLRQRSEALTVREIAGIISQASEALQHAHSHQIVHQDVKPSNFLIRTRSASGQQAQAPDLLLSDFGIAKFTSATSSASQSVRGTPAYMAPEQWDGHPQAATDQYALAIMAYQLLTGRVPFVGRMEQVMRQHFTTVPQPPSTITTGIPLALDAVILRALAKNPTERFPTIAEFGRAFVQATEHHEDLRATLAISQEEAVSGTNRTLTLPGGRQVPISLPAGIINGQTIRFQGLGEPYYEGGPRGPLVLTLLISQQSAPAPKDSLPIERASNPGLPGSQYGVSSANSQTVPPPPPPIIGPAPITPMHINMDPRSYSTVPQPQTYQQPRPSSPGIAGYQSTPGIGGMQGPIGSSAIAPKGSNWGMRILVIVLALIVLIPSSVLGVFLYNNHVAQSNADATVAVQSTANARVQATQTAYNNPTAVAGRATATFTAYPPYSLSHPDAKLARYDPLAQPGEWPNFSDADYGGQCRFADNSYHVTQSKANKIYLCDGKTNYTNFLVEVQATILKGDCGGIDFRNNGANKDYIFVFCQNGDYALYAYTDNTHSKTLLNGTSTTIIHTGLGVANTIAVEAQGASQVLYVNGQHLDTGLDSSFASGTIGFVADNKTQATDVVFTNAKIWTLA